jgi:hypothetical protein
MVDEETKEKAIILSNLRRAVVIITESLKVGDNKDKSTLAPAITGNLFNQLYEILTSTKETDLEEELSDVDVQRTILNVK